MKTLVLSMISIAATVAAMTACTSESDGIDDLTKDAPVEIKMSAKVLNIETRATGPINDVNTAIDDIGFIRKDAKPADANTIDWTTSPTEYSAKIAAGGAITFTPVPYYPADKATSAYMIGYHPKGTVTSGAVEYTIDGNTDIMYAERVDGNKEKTTALTPNFNHLLSQLVLKITGGTTEAEANAAAAAWGTISSISVKSIQPKYTLALSTGKLTVVTNDNEATAINFEAPASGFPTIATTTDDAGYCMIPPQGSQITLAVTTDKTTKDVIITIPERTGENPRPANTTLAGEAYTVTLTFKANEIESTASVTAWTPVAGGEGTVD
ncbi:fimbrillin family protein [Parabacteroides gordonii]|jgi:hypothetical protein|uniref:fimbrillin family protein n=1 Tax=Parabacteroides gordonii TaxID=574930 RepID=UPI000EBB8F15|nr:fimbrillin family protein [Parabacteroides gordonii]RGP17212.1 hypothetical protein DXB27_07050 [Parabacteroides gordonii]